MLYKNLADLVLVLNLVFVLFAVLGAVLVPVSYTHLTLPTN